MTVEEQAKKRKIGKLLAEADNPQAYAEIGQILHEQVEYLAAVRAYSLGLRLDPNNDSLHCRLGLTYHNLGEHHEAISHYRKATELNRYNSEANYYLGFILIQEGRIPEAITYLQQALALNPNLHPAYHFLGNALARNGQYEDALDLLKYRIANSYPNLAPDVIFTLGELLSRRQNYQTESCHAQACVGALLESLSKSQIHCFGDSHRSVFNNLAKITCHNVGAGTAYNLVSTKSTTGAGSKILNAVTKLRPESDAILLVFGEIDCIEHLYKNAFRSNRSPEELINELVERFLAFASSLSNQGYEVLIYGPAFSGVALNSYGPLRERNQLIRLFNQQLENACNGKERLAFASLNHVLVDSRMLPNFNLSSDGRHLDNFPKGSKIFQGIILSQFLAATNSRRKNQHAVENFEYRKLIELSINKPYMLFQPLGKKTPIVDPTLGLEIGLLAAGTELTLSWQYNNKSALIIDLLDHLSVNGVLFRLASRGNKGLPAGNITVAAIAKDGKYKLGEHQIEPLDQQTIRLSFTPTIARALWFTIDWEHASQENSAGPINLSELQIIGAYHTTP